MTLRSPTHHRRRAGAPATKPSGSRASRPIRNPFYQHAFVLFLGSVIFALVSSSAQAANASPVTVYEIHLEIPAEEVDGFVENPKRFVRDRLSEQDLEPREVTAVGLPADWDRSQAEREGLYAIGMIARDRSSGWKDSAVTLAAIPVSPRASQSALHVENVIGEIDRVAVNLELSDSEGDDLIESPAEMLEKLADDKLLLAPIEPQEQFTDPSQAFLEAWATPRLAFADPGFDPEAAAEKGELRGEEVFEAGERGEKQGIVIIDHSDETPFENRILTDTDEIHPGYFTEFEGGVLIGAHPDALDEPLAVEVEWFDPFDDPGFFPEDGSFQQVEQFVEIKVADADRSSVDTPVDAPFLVILPVPEHFDSQHLFPANFVYGEFSHYFPDEFNFWVPASGTFDPQYNLFGMVAPTIGNSERPTRVGLIEHRSIPTEKTDAVLDPVATAFSETENERTTLRTPQSEGSIIFEVRNRTTESDNTISAVLQEAETALYNGLNKYEEMAGSFTPLLHPPLSLDGLNPFNDDIHLVYYILENEWIETQLNTILDLIDDVPDIDLSDEICDTFNGFYIPYLGATCLHAAGDDFNNPDPGFARTTSHELFHAIQWGYHDATTIGYPWIVEGTARVAESLADPLGISGNELPPPLDVKLSDSRTVFDLTDWVSNEQHERPYRREYFFHDLFERAELDFSDMGHLLSEGLQTADVDTFINKRTDFSGLAEAHWKWVRNAAFEADINPEIEFVKEDEDGEEITVEKGVYGKPDQINPWLFKENHPVLAVSSSLGTDTINVSLEPLSARMVKLNFTTQSDGAIYEATFSTASGDAPRLRLYTESPEKIAVHRDPDSESGVFHSGDIGTLITAPEASEPSAWVLVANPNPGQSATYEIHINGPHPEGGQYFPSAANIEITTDTRDWVTREFDVLIDASDPNDARHELIISDPTISGKRTDQFGFAQRIQAGNSSSRDKIDYDLPQLMLPILFNFAAATEGWTFTGTDTFEYTITNQLGLSDTATVAVEVIESKASDLGIDRHFGEVYDFVMNAERYLTFHAMKDDILGSCFAFEGEVPIDIGALSEDGSTVTKALNAENQAVGWSHDEDRIMRAFQWNESDGIQPLYEEPGVPSRAIDINNSGVAVGHVSSLETGGSYSVLWEEDNFVPFGQELDGDNVPTGINEANQVVGMKDLPDNPIDFFGALTAGLPGDERSSLVEQALESGATGFFYDANSSAVISIEPIDGPGIVPRDINDRGEVVGISTADEAGRTTHAFFWREGELTDLGTLGGTHSEAIAVNNDGLVVGNSEGARGEPRGFLWRRNSGMTDLNDLIDDELNWTVVRVFGVTDRGEIQVRVIDADNRSLAVLLEPAAEPEPLVWPDGSELRVAEATTETVTLFWAEAGHPEEVERYWVFRDGELAAELDPGVNRHTVAGLSPDTEYIFHLEAAHTTGIRAGEGFRVSARTHPEIPETTYKEWIAEKWKEHEDTFPNLTEEDLAPAVDLSGDGMKNIAVFSFGADPFLPGDAFPQGGGFAPGDTFKPVLHTATDEETDERILAVSFTRRRDATDIEYHIELSKNLQTWERADSSVEKVAEPVMAPDGRTEIVTFRIDTPEEEPGSFARVRIEFQE